MTSNIKPTLALAALALTGLINTASAGAWILDFATPWAITSYSPSAATWTKTFSSVPNPAGGTSINTIYGYYDPATNTLDRGPEMITATITTTGVSNGVLVNSTSPLTLQGIPSLNPYVTYTLTLSSPVTGLSLYAWDIDSDPSSPALTDVWGFGETTSPVIGVSTGSEIVSADPFVAGFTTFKTTAIGTNALDNNATPWIPESELGFTAATHHASFSSGEFVWGFQGSGTTSVTRTHNLLGVIAPEPGSAMTAFLTGAAMVGLVNRRKRQS
ncbi:MAG: hypothetical protein ACK5CW_11185 [Verrucomicrobiota bacterium]|jgi:hypothetical protein